MKKGRPATTWRLAVAELKAEAESQRWRANPMSLLLYPSWQSIVVAWADIGAGITSMKPWPDMPPSLVSVEERRVWVWEVVWNAVDAAFPILCQRVPLPDLDVMFVFQELAERMLIFPDGSVHEMLLRSLEMSVIVNDAEGSMKLHQITERAEKSKARIRAMQQKALKSGAPETVEDES